MKKILLSVAIAIGLSACSGVSPKNAEQTVFSLQGSYNAALTVAVAYKKLPPCMENMKIPVCSDPKIVKQLQDADDVAAPAIITARNIVRSPGLGLNVESAIHVASEAVKTFSQITSTLKVK